MFWQVLGCCVQAAFWSPRRQKEASRRLTGGDGPAAVHMLLLCNRWRYCTACWPLTLFFRLVAITGCHVSHEPSTQNKSRKRLPRPSSSSRLGFFPPSLFLFSRLPADNMPRIAVKNVDKLRKQHPREYSLLFELGGTADGIDSQVRCPPPPPCGEQAHARADLHLPDDALRLAGAFCRPCWMEPRSMVMQTP